jgi:hypothetical protein
MGHRLTAQNLEWQLTAYAAAVPSAGKSANWSDRLGRWSVYAAATGASLASATSADASVITGFSGAHLSVSPCAAAPCNHGTSQFTRLSFGSFAMTVIVQLANNFHSALSRHATASLYLPSPWGGGFMHASGGPYANRFARNFAAGSFITDGLGARQDLIFALASNGFRLGYFDSGVPGFVGFRTAQDDLGWIQVTWSSSLHNGYADTVDFGSFGINTTPGAAIEVAPEPGTLPLSLLALGAAGIAAWRRRTVQSAPEA